jgi:hypothetical protein
VNLLGIESLRRWHVEIVTKAMKRVETQKLIRNRISQRTVDEDLKFARDWERHSVVRFIIEIERKEVKQVRNSYANRLKDQRY